MKLFWAALSCIFCTGHISFAEPRLTYNSYGMPGLVDMPSSQSAPDAELSFSISQAGKSLRNTLMFQITPRLTGAFRYSSIERPGSTLYDRSFDLRYRLLDETDRRPAIAVGLQDFISTGVYSGEYIAASKNLGPVVASAGIECRLRPRSALCHRSAPRGRRANLSGRRPQGQGGFGL